MTLQTRDFGSIEIEEKDIITFVQPIFGFDDKKFVLLFDDEIGDCFAWLQSAEHSGLCLTLANPSLLNREYAPSLSKDTADILEGEVSAKWLVMVVTDDLTKSKVNLKSPIVINYKNNHAMQCISEDNLPIRYELFSGKEFE